MESKDYILQKCRKNIDRQFDRPDLTDIKALTFDDPLATFIEKSKEMGCDVVVLEEGDSIDGVVACKFPDAKKICSNLKEAGCATINPDDSEDIKELDGTDVGIVEGRLGVAENGCVWIPQQMRRKAVCFISENLVIVLDKNRVCSNMHEAYRRIEFNDYGYGSFISGPSKTADIAQVLVIGAQAARSVTLILR